MHSAFHSLCIGLFSRTGCYELNVNYFNPSLLGSIHDVMKIWRIVLTRCSILYLFNKQENGDPS